MAEVVEVRIILELTCPGCNYQYHLNLIVPQSHEICPVCGYSDIINKFVGGDK